MEQTPYQDGPAHRPISEPLREVGQRRSFWYSLGELFAFRQLLFRLIAREIRAKYKGSTLGILWSLVRPLAQLLVYVIAIGKFLGASRSIPDFAIFVFTGLTIWTLFLEIVSMGTGSVLGNSGLIKKVYLPREIFPLAAVGGALFNFFVQFIVLVGATIVLGRPPLSHNLLLVPLSVALIVVLGTAIALVLSAVNVYLRDVAHIVEIALLILFWGSPTLYSMRFVHEALGGSWIEQIYLANPITLAVLGMQKGMWITGAYDPAQYWPPDLPLRMVIALLVSFVALYIGQRVFSRLQGNFAQEL